MFNALALILFLQAELGPPDVVKHGQEVANLWQGCAQYEAGKHASLDDNAETIADVAMSKCAPFETLLKADVEKLTINAAGQKFDDEHAQALVSQVRARARNAAVARVLDERLKRAKGTK